MNVGTVNKFTSLDHVKALCFVFIDEDPLPHEPENIAHDIVVGITKSLNELG